VAQLPDVFGDNRLGPPLSVGLLYRSEQVIPAEHPLRVLREHDEQVAPAMRQVDLLAPHGKLPRFAAQNQIAKRRLVATGRPNDAAAATTRN
jgi:hypothetical protein